MLVIYAAEFIENKLKVDDPVGAIAVHGVCGTFGVLAVGIFANGSYGGAWNGSDVTAIEGVVAGECEPARRPGPRRRSCIWTVIFGFAFAFFKIQNALMKGGIRPTAEVELAGMDLPEMGALAYPEFDMIAAEVLAEHGNGDTPTVEEEPESTPV